MPATKPRKSKFKVVGEMPPLRKLEGAGDSAIGIFQGIKAQEIKDKETGVQKMVRFYLFREEDDEKKKFVVSGRMMLDQAFDSVAELAGGVDVLEGEVMEFRRLKDTKRDGAKRLGNYEVEVYETIT